MEAGHFDTKPVQQSGFLSTGMMAEYLGLSPQALHWYESQGLVNPQRVGKYRKYSSDDLCLLSRVRFYHQCGFSTKETSRLLGSNIDVIESHLDERIQAMEQAVHTEQIKLAKLKKNVSLIKRFENAQLVFERVRMHAFHFKECYRVDDGTFTFEGSSLKAWTDCIPLTRYTLIASDAFSNEGCNLVGVALAEPYVSHVSVEVQKDIRQGTADYYPSVEALYGMASFLGPVSFKDVASDFVKESSVSMGDLRGDLMAHPVTCHRLGDKVKTYWEAWFPLA